jgi:hypothetical protein
MTSDGIKLIATQTWTALHRFGPRAAYFVFSANLRRKSGSHRQILHRLPLNGLAHPLCLREGRSDPFFFGQIFLDQEFGLTRSLNVSSIIDLGGSAGLATSGS